MQRFELAGGGHHARTAPKEGHTVRALVPATFLAALMLTPLSQASNFPSARIEADQGRVQPLIRSTTVTRTPSGLILTASREWAFSFAAYEWRIALSGKETLAKLPDGSIAVVAPWPPNPGDGTDYPVVEPIDRDPPPLPASDPYRYSADPDGSMAADEAMHDVGPFDPAYADEYLPDPWVHEPTSDPDDPLNANSGPPPGSDTSDPIAPSDNERVPEFDPLDALLQAELSRSDQIVALIAAPRATDALGRRVPVRLSIRRPNAVELRFGPTLTAAFPYAASSRLTFNPDAFP